MEELMYQTVLSIVKDPIENNKLPIGWYCRIQTVQINLFIVMPLAMFTMVAVKDVNSGIELTDTNPLRTTSGRHTI
jgi:hypothetical protein